MKLKLLLTGAATAFLVAATADAHTSFLRPNAFDLTHSPAVTLQASFTEDFSNPEVGVKSGDWHYIAPNGVRYAYDNVVELKQITILENTLAQEGTYKFTTGERLGRVGKLIQTTNGDYKFARGENGQPPVLEVGERFVTSQTATVAEAYVTKGAPTKKAFDLPTGRLAFEPVTHPNEIYLDVGFELNVTFGGAVLAGQDLQLMREGGSYNDDKGGRTVTTDADGHLAITFDQPGVYLLMTRHKSVAPEGAETEMRSYTTSLTFEVTR